MLRLTGGDPFMFGDGPEEIDNLTEKGISFQVVPGITTASGCAAYAGIPLTHPNYAQSCVFITAHSQGGSAHPNWDTVMQPAQTVVIHMEPKGLSTVCRELIAHGITGDMPAALIEQGTTPRQKVFIGNLETLPGIVGDSDVHAPALMIVGDVVRLREKPAWFESLPTNQEEDLHP